MKCWTRIRIELARRTLAIFHSSIRETHLTRDLIELLLTIVVSRRCRFLHSEHDRRKDLLLVFSCASRCKRKKQHSDPCNGYPGSHHSSDCITESADPYQARP